MAAGKREKLAVLKAVRSAVGRTFRFSMEEFVPDGINLDMAKDITRVMVENGIDVLDLSVGFPDGRVYPCFGEV